jgi:hypothetical protein
LIHDRRHRAAHELLKQGLLVLEVEVERALGDARLRGDVVEPRRRVAARGKYAECGLEDGLPLCPGLPFSPARPVARR